MGLNHQQFQKIHGQPQKQWVRRWSLFSTKRLLVLGSVFCLSIAGVMMAVIYGNHTQWQTAHSIEKTSHKAVSKATKQPVVKASQVKQVAAQKNIKPDYSGTGGLSSKADMLKLAQSNQVEILRGHVAVPSFRISEPIYEGTSNHVLAIGAGMNEPNLKFGSGLVPIFAHNMGDYNALWPYHPTKFSALQNMTEKTILGKAIYLSDGHTVYRYKATKLDYGIAVGVMNQELAVDNTGKPKVKLIACLEDQAFWQQVKASHYTNFTAKKRIVLTGELVSKQPMATLDTTLKAQLK